MFLLFLPPPKKMNAGVRVVMTCTPAGIFQFRR